MVGKFPDVRLAIIGYIISCILTDSCSKVHLSHNLEMAHPTLISFIHLGNIKWVPSILFLLMTVATYCNKKIPVFAAFEDQYQPVWFVNFVMCFYWPSDWVNLITYGTLCLHWLKYSSADNSHTDKNNITLWLAILIIPKSLLQGFTVMFYAVWTGSIPGDLTINKILDAEWILLFVWPFVPLVDPSK